MLFSFQRAPIFGPAGTQPRCQRRKLLQTLAFRFIFAGENRVKSPVGA
jgi:hypothetical protein